MSSFDGNAVTASAFANSANRPFPYFSGGSTYDGGSGNDTILGSDPQVQHRYYGSQPITDQVLGHDTLTGGGGNDYMDGRGGNDSMSGNDGNDTVVGGSGNDAINGNAGDDHMEGGTGNDTVRGGMGNDTITGGDGADFISGDVGNDAQYGNAGADTFNFFAGAGADVVADFNRGEGDSVRIESGTYTLTQVGANTVITMNDGAQMTLQNVTYASLDAGWIHS